MTTVYVTAPPDAAEGLARTLVEEGLAACVNRIDCRSTFRWEGSVVDETEVALFIKTVPERYGDVEDRVEELHPYEVPCIERFEAADAFGPFAEWIAESVE